MDFDLSWMAWTAPTAYFFIFIVASIACMGALEAIWPGGNERYGVFGLTTTRGDRLFITYLGSAFVFIGWLAFGGPDFWTSSGLGQAVGAPREHLWGALGLALIWGGFVFWKV